MGSEHHHGRTSAYMREPALGRSTRATQPIVASGDNGGSLGNYADPGTKVGVADASSRWAPVLTKNTTDTVHTSSFEYRVTLFQRLFASSADFDLACRPLVRSQIFAAYGTTTVRLMVMCDFDQRRHRCGKRADQAADHCVERHRRGDTRANGSQISEKTHKPIGKTTSRGWIRCLARLAGVRIGFLRCATTRTTDTSPFLMHTCRPFAAIYWKSDLRLRHR